MSKEKYAYFTYMGNSGPIEQQTAEIEWLNIQTKETIGKLTISKEDFFKKSREELWQDFQKWLEEQNSDAGPEVVAVDPVD